MKHLYAVILMLISFLSCVYQSLYLKSSAALGDRIECYFSNTFLMLINIFAKNFGRSNFHATPLDKACINYRLEQLLHLNVANAVKKIVKNETTNIF
jgi:hypothetical protein